jgi:hypothetical protein
MAISSSGLGWDCGTISPWPDFGSDIVEKTELNGRWVVVEMVGHGDP